MSGVERTTVTPERERIKERRRETVPASCTVLDRDAEIVTVEGPRVTRYKVRCRERVTTILGSTLMDTRHVAWFPAYLKAYDAAEAWAYRGEQPQGDAV